MPGAVLGAEDSAKDKMGMVPALWSSQSSLAMQNPNSGPPGIWLDGVSKSWHAVAAQCTGSRAMHAEPLVLWLAHSNRPISAASLSLPGLETQVSHFCSCVTLR